jgi:predicted AlkP superfamily pyrophosphatase or phosphodiesterase
MTILSTTTGLSLSGAVLTMGLFLGACGDSKPEPIAYGPKHASSAAPVLVVGMDGLEWDIMAPLLRAGELPNMASLMERGSYGLFGTMHPTWSPRIWTTVATGKNPEQHGILDFVHYDEDRTPLALYTSEDRKTKAWWNILSEAGVVNDTIGWWMTFPVEPVDGVMVAQTNAPVGAEGPSKGLLRVGVPAQVFPASLESQFFATMAAQELELDATIEQIFGKPNLFNPEARQRWEDCRWAFRADSTYLAIALERAKAGPAPLTAVYFGGTDIVGHRFFAAYKPGPFGFAKTSDEVRTFKDVIPAYYRYMDAVLGELLEAWPKDTTVLVVSDHGMVSQHEEIEKLAQYGAPKSGKSKYSHTGGHGRAEAGVILAAGPLIKNQGAGFDAQLFTRSGLVTQGTVVDLCPTLLTIFGVPAGQDMAGQTMATVLVEGVKALPSIPTHDDADWLEARPHTGIQPVDSGGRINQLENLGYLDGKQ